MRFLYIWQAITKSCQNFANIVRLLTTLLSMEVTFECPERCQKVFEPELTHPLVLMAHIH